MSMGECIEIRSRDYWIKVVGFLQHNWALVDDWPGGVRVWFIHDRSGVFDHIDFTSSETARQALKRNGFARVEDDFLSTRSPLPPPPPFEVDAHPNGKIYSSGRFWK